MARSRSIDEILEDLARRTPESKQFGHMVVFVRANEPPYYCWFCEGEITEDLNVHHTDEDHTNNTKENLKAAHRGCHIRHHRTGKPLTIEHRAKLSEAHIGQQGNSEALRRAWADGKYDNRRKRRV